MTMVSIGTATTFSITIATDVMEFWEAAALSMTMVSMVTLMLRVVVVSMGMLMTPVSTLLHLATA